MKKGVIFSWMRVFDLTAEVSELRKVAILCVGRAGCESPDKREEQLPLKHVSWKMTKHMSVILGDEWLGDRINVSRLRKTYADKDTRNRNCYIWRIQYKLQEIKASTLQLYGLILSSEEDWNGFRLLHCFACCKEASPKGCAWACFVSLTHWTNLEDPRETGDWGKISEDRWDKWGRWDLGPCVYL